MRRWFAIALFASLLPGVASAQVLRASGVIVDQSGAVLPGVNMRATLASDPQATPSTAITDATGRYEFRLSPGQYNVTASLPGFASLEMTLTMATADVKRDLMMKIGSLQETITITPGDRPQPSRARPPAPAPAPTSSPRPAVAPSSPTGAAAPGPPPAKSTPIRVGGSIKPPTKTFNVAPAYPPALAANKLGGTVVLEAVIGSNGHVQEVKTLRSPHDELTHAASEAIQEWEFTPTLLNGVPVPVVMTATFFFNPE